MKKGFIKFILVIVIGVMAVLYVATGSFDFLTAAKNKILSIKNSEGIEERLSGALQAIKREIINSSPLIGKNQSPKAFLTHDGVVQWTNTQRKTVSNLPPLVPNSKLDKIALLRLQDMFAKQYFEHINPQGIGASDIADDVGYEFIAIGENIALGNFENDQVLVQAWMDSPGHRANILNTKFTQIGVAVASSTYQGRKTWIGVQIFGKPASACPAVNHALKQQIATTEGVLETAKAKLAQMALQLEAMKNNGSSREAYNEKVAEYNKLVNDVNSLNTSIKQMISTYNTQVETYNACLKK